LPDFSPCGPDQWRAITIPRDSVPLPALCWERKAVSCLVRRGSRSWSTWSPGIPCSRPPVSLGGAVRLFPLQFSACATKSKENESTCTGADLVPPTQTRPHLCRFAVRAIMGTPHDFLGASRRTRSGRSPSCQVNKVCSLSKRVNMRLNHYGCRNINLLSIACAGRHGLRSRLTLGRKSLPRNPWVYGGAEFHRPLRYLCLHPHFRELHRQSPSGFDAPGTLPYQTMAHAIVSGASVCCLSPIIFGAEPLDESAITHCLNGGCF